MIVRTTVDYYAEEKSITCAYTNFSKSTVTLFIEYDKRYVQVFTNASGWRSDFKRTTNNSSELIKYYRRSNKYAEKLNKWLNLRRCAGDF